MDRREAYPNINEPPRNRLLFSRDYGEVLTLDGKWENCVVLSAVRMSNRRRFSSLQGCKSANTLRNATQTEPNLSTRVAFERQVLRTHEQPVPAHIRFYQDWPSL